MREMVFGALAPSILNQLIDQGLSIEKREGARLQKIADAITLLCIHGILSDSEKHRARMRLMKQISRLAVYPDA